mmetsp:Transcript_26646/g.44466  ORF Transcript_26646/g.44466 Transcript_26646/m.44466 type:complete len:165 (+) Transcript_26646:24-518(+)
MAQKKEYTLEPVAVFLTAHDVEAVPLMVENVTPLPSSIIDNNNRKMEHFVNLTGINEEIVNRLGLETVDDLRLLTAVDLGAKDLLPEGTPVLVKRRFLIVTEYIRAGQETFHESTTLATVISSNNARETDGQSGLCLCYVWVCLCYVFIILIFRWLWIIWTLPH